MRISIKKSLLPLQIIVMLYALGGIVLYYMQDKILFPHLHEQKKQAFVNIVPQNVIEIPVNKDDTLHLYHFVPSDDTVSKGLVIFLHGGEGNVFSYANRADEFLRLNYEVWMPEYSFLEKQDKPFSVEDVSTAAVQTFILAKNNDAAKRRIVVYGQSIGVIGAASIARSLSGDNKNKVTIILENPFSSLADVLHHQTYIYPWSVMCKYKSDPLEDFKASEVKVSYCTRFDGSLFSEASSQGYRELLKSPNDLLKVPVEKAKALNETQLYQNWLANLMR